MTEVVVATKPNGVPLSKIQIDSVVEATRESESRSEKMVKQLVTRFGNQNAETRLKAAQILIACMERGHPSFRQQLRERADQMQKFFGNAPNLSEPDAEKYYEQYVDQGKIVLNMMYEKGPRRNVDVSMSQAAFIADMNEKAKNIAPLSNLDGIGSSAIEPVEPQNKNILQTVQKGVTSVMNTALTTFTNLTGVQLTSGTQFTQGERMDSTFKITGDVEEAKRNMPDFSRGREQQESQPTTLAPRLLGGFAADEEQEAIDLTTGRSRNPISFTSTDEAPREVHSTYTPEVKQAAVEPGSLALPEVRSETGELESRIVDTATAASGVGVMPSKAVIQQFVDQAKKSDLNFIAACLADKAATEGRLQSVQVPRMKAFCLLHALTEPSFVALRPTVTAMLTSQADAWLAGYPLITNATVRARATEALQRLGLMQASASPQATHTPTAAGRGRSGRGFQAVPTPATGSSPAKATPAAPAGDAPLLDFGFDAPASSTQAPTAQPTASVGTDFAAMFGGPSQPQQTQAQPLISMQPAPASAAASTTPQDTSAFLLSQFAGLSTTPSTTQQPAASASADPFGFGFAQPAQPQQQQQPMMSFSTGATVNLKRTAQKQNTNEDLFNFSDIINSPGASPQQTQSAQPTQTQQQDNGSAFDFI